MTVETSSSSSSSSQSVLQHHHQRQEHHYQQQGFFTSAVAVQHKMRNGGDPDHYQGEPSQEDFPAFRKVIWPAVSPTPPKPKLDEPHRHHRDQIDNGSHPVDHPLQWLKQAAHHSSNHQSEYEMELAKCSWDAHMSNRVSRSKTRSKDIMERARSFERAASALTSTSTPTSSRPSSVSRRRRSPSQGKSSDQYWNKVVVAETTDLDPVSGQQKWPSVGRVDVKSWEDRIRTEGRSNTKYKLKTPPSTTSCGHGREEQQEMHRFAHRVAEKVVDSLERKTQEDHEVGGVFRAVPAQGVVDNESGHPSTDWRSQAEQKREEQWRVTAERNEKQKIKQQCRRRQQQQQQQHYQAYHEVHHSQEEVEELQRQRFLEERRQYEERKRQQQQEQLLQREELRQQEKRRQEHLEQQEQRRQEQEYQERLWRHQQQEQRQQEELRMQEHQRQEQEHQERLRRQQQQERRQQEELRFQEHQRQEQEHQERLRRQQQQDRRQQEEMRLQEHQRHEQEHQERLRRQQQQQGESRVKLKKNHSFNSESDLYHISQFAKIKTGQVQEKRHFWIRSTSSDQLHSQSVVLGNTRRRRWLGEQDWIRQQQLNSLDSAGSNPGSRPGSSLAQPVGQEAGLVRRTVSEWGKLSKSQSSGAVLQEADLARPGSTTSLKNAWHPPKPPTVEPEVQLPEVHTNQVQATVQKWPEKAKAKTKEPSVKLLNVAIERQKNGDDGKIHMSSTAHQQMASFLNGTNSTEVRQVHQVQEYQSHYQHQELSTYKKTSAPSPKPPRKSRESSADKKFQVTFNQLPPDLPEPPKKIGPNPSKIPFPKGKGPKVEAKPRSTFQGQYAAAVKQEDQAPPVQVTSPTTSASSDFSFQASLPKPVEESWFQSKTKATEQGQGQGRQPIPVLAGWFSEDEDKSKAIKTERSKKTKHVDFVEPVQAQDDDTTEDDAAKFSVKDNIARFQRGSADHPITGQVLLHRTTSLEKEEAERSQRQRELAEIAKARAESSFKHDDDDNDQQETLKDARNRELQEVAAMRSQCTSIDDDVSKTRLLQTKDQRAKELADVAALRAQVSWDDVVSSTAAGAGARCLRTPEPDPKEIGDEDKSLEEIAAFIQEHSEGLREGYDVARVPAPPPRDSSRGFMDDLCGNKDLDLLESRRKQ